MNCKCGHEKHEWLYECHEKGCDCVDAIPSSYVADLSRRLEIAEKALEKMKENISYFYGPNVTIENCPICRENLEHGKEALAKIREVWK